MTATPIEKVSEPIFQGEPQTYSATVHVADVKKGMLLKQHDNTQVEAATAGSEVIGVALEDAAVDEKVTYAMPQGDFIARLVCAESQTINAGDTVIAATSSISAVTYNGQVGKMTDVTFTAGGATGPEVTALVTQMRSVVGKAVEDCVTGADINKLIRVRVTGAPI